MRSQLSRLLINLCWGSELVVYQNAGRQVHGSDAVCTFWARRQNGVEGHPSRGSLQCTTPGAAEGEGPGEIIGEGVGMGVGGGAGMGVRAASGGYVGMWVGEGVGMVPGVGVGKHMGGTPQG